MGVIGVSNNGDMWRDFTYIVDIVEGIIRIADVIPARNVDWKVEYGTPASSYAPYTVCNIGHGSPINLLDFILEIENALGIRAKKIQRYAT